ncbi:MAG: FecR family protein [Elusimicrobiota bacterium]
MKKNLFYVLLLTSVLSFQVVFLNAVEMAGEVNNAKGTVEILKTGDTEWEKILEGIQIEENDRIRTGPRSSCEIEMDDGSMIHIAANSQTSLQKLQLKEDEHTSSFQLFFGKMIASISKLKKTKMEVHTPTTICAVRGTEFAVEASSSETNIGVFEGSVAVTNPEVAEAEETVLNPDQETTVEKGINPEAPEKLSAAMIKNRERMLELRKRVKALRERLRRVPLEKRIKARQTVKARFDKLRQQRQIQKDRIHEKRENIRQQRRAPKK